MKNSKSIRFFVGFLILTVSALLWILLLFNPGNIMTVQHCHVTMEGPSTASLEMLLQMNPFSDLMIGWVLMVLAMMLPKLIGPIQYIYERSFKNRRLWFALLFILGYTAVWTVAGIFMNGAILGFSLLMPNSFVPAIMIGTVALIWQFSPMKQQFLNRGHDHRCLRAFGWGAQRDVLEFGMLHGIWCVGSGWAIMLFPMLLPQGHNIAMLIVAFIMISEHMEHPQLPKWRFDMRLKLLRIIVAQTKIRLSNST